MRTIEALIARLGQEPNSLWAAEINDDLTRYGYDTNRARLDDIVDELRCFQTLFRAANSKKGQKTPDPVLTVRPPSLVLEAKRAKDSENELQDIHDFMAYIS